MKLKSIVASMFTFLLANSQESCKDACLMPEGPFTSQCKNLNMTVNSYNPSSIYPCKFTIECTEGTVSTKKITYYLPQNIQLLNVTFNNEILEHPVITSLGLRPESNKEVKSLCLFPTGSYEKSCNNLKIEIYDKNDCLFSARCFSTDLYVATGCDKFHVYHPTDRYMAMGYVQSKALIPQLTLFKNVDNNNGFLSHENPIFKTLRLTDRCP